MGTEAFWLPAAMGGMGALGGALGGGDDRGMSPFGQLHGQPDPFGIGEWGSIFPPTLLANYMSNLEQMGGIAVARAAQPITLAGTAIQQPGWYGGGGMVMPQGLSGMDPANIRPSILGVPGVRFGEPDPAALARRAEAVEYDKSLPPDSQDRKWTLDKEREYRERQMAKWMFPGAPRETAESQVETFAKPFEEGGKFQASLPMFQGLRQPGPTPIEPGGGFSGVFGALKLLGVEMDPMGNLTMGGEYPLFTGSIRPPPPTPDERTQPTDTGPAPDTSGGGAGGAPQV